ncbi:MAG TPA: ABC transporter permease [Gemmatimonadaceae bacterium]|jgi:predicted permease|nr:ABC transporter permease [Gemmatimonadaceae bacterium]
MRDIMQDIRFAVRTLGRTPMFSLLAILTMALGIGANTAAFTMVHGVLMRRLPYAGDDRLVRVRQPSATAPDVAFSVLEVADYRAQVKDFAAVSEYHSMPFQLYGTGEPQRVQTGVVSDNFFTMLGVKPLLGRAFLPGEEAVGAPAVVLLSYRYWMKNFAGDPRVVGTKFTMNDRIHTVVGVLPPLPPYPDDNDIWMPAGACPFRDNLMNNRRGRMLSQFAMLAPGVSPGRATKDVATIAARLHQQYPDAYPAARKLSTAVAPLHDELTARSRPLFLTLLAAAGFVLLIALANFANLMLARQLRRQREIALREALGAGSGRLFRQLATESVCLSIVAGICGVFIAYSGLGLLRALATRVTPRASEIAIDPTVLAFALVVSLLVGFVVALVPLARARSFSLSDALRATAVATTASRRDGRARSALVGVQVAVAFVLLVGAGLMVRSLVRLEHVDGGYATANVLSARVDLDWTRYLDEHQNLKEAATFGFTDRLLSRLSAEPGVVAVAAASNIPLNRPTPFKAPIQIRGRDATADRLPTADVTVATSNYFAAVRIPVLQGHPYSDADRDTSAEQSVMISERLARANWPAGDPIGKEISLDNGAHWLRIGGVVGDVHQNGLSQDITDEVYLPYFNSQNVGLGMRVLVRTVAEPAPMGKEIRATVHDIDTRQAVSSIQTLDEMRGVNLSEPRITTALLLSFAVLALIITVAGLAGIISYSVTQRVNEIGIRVALGAERASVLWLIMRQGLILGAAGLAIGVVVSLSVTGLMTRLLYDTRANDPGTFAMVGLLLLTVTACACAIPARRALRIDPVQALRG